MTRETGTELAWEAGARGGAVQVPTPSAGATRPRWRQDLGVALLGLALLVLWDLSGWDLALSRLYGGPTGFAWRDGLLTRTVLHDGGRWLAWGVAALLAWDVWRPWRPGPSRRRRAHALAVMLGSMTAVSLLKRASATSCPWDLAEFGGRASYVPHWLWGLGDGGPGHCFPSGHAVAAFGYLGLHVLWRDHDPRLARWALGLTATAGLLFGWAQLARGAHFASHTMWSAWWCWVLCAGALAWPARPDGAQGCNG